jgi:aspartate beta-hydroxylase
MIVFDDSFEHEVWNGSDEVRIVLLLDINHHELSREQVVLYEN